MQYHKFYDNGFVIHKVFLNGVKYSCWFDSKGKLTSAESFHGSNAQNVPLDLHTNVAASLQRIGRVMRPIILKSE